MFNDVFYEQCFGMAMGGPLSPLLANIYMEFFERDILSRVLPKDVIWYRYIDDIICIWPSNLDESDFLNIMNNLVPSIKFTVEVEKEKKLPFLDMNIYRTPNGFRYSVYRKPTSNNNFIHLYSGHNISVKRSVFNSLFLRAYRVCSPEFLDSELDNIYSIGFDLKYPINIIEKCHSKVRKSFYGCKEKISFECCNLLNLPYHPNFDDIPSLLKKLGINVVFNNNNCIKSKLIKNNPTNLSGSVYSIPCQECNKFYIGQTGKDIKHRIQQHKYCVRRGDESNAIFCHIQDKDHPFNWEQGRVIIKCNSFILRNIFESVLIRDTYDNNINISLGLYNDDELLRSLIINFYKLSRFNDVK